MLVICVVIVVDVVDVTKNRNNNDSNKKQLMKIPGWNGGMARTTRGACLWN